MINSRFALSLAWMWMVLLISVLLHEFGHYLIFKSRGMVRGYGVYISCPAIDNTDYDTVGLLSGFIFGCLAYPLMFLDPDFYPYFSQYFPYPLFVFTHYCASVFDFWTVIKHGVLRKKYTVPPVKRGLLGWWWYIPLKKEE